MPVIFKLVGCNTGSKVLEIQKEMEGVLRLSNIISMFEILGLSQEDFEKIKVVANSETLKSNEKVYHIGSDSPFVVFIFSSDKEIKQKLVEIFMKNASNNEENNNSNPSEKRPLIGTVSDPTALNRHTAINENADSYLTKSIDDKKIETEPELTQSVIDKMNEKTIKEFEDENFKQLIKIYYTSPDSIKKFISFVTNGDIVNLKIVKPDEDKDYSKELEYLKNIGINESDENIIETLKFFNGHLNLSLRMLLCRKSVLFN